MKRNLLTLLITIGTVFLLNAQNVGIGNPTPVEKLDVSGNIQTSGSISNASSMSISYPEGAYLYDGNSGHNKYIVIWLPNDASIRSMMNIEAKFYRYSTNYAANLIFSGYTYPPTPSWSNTAFTSTGNVDINRADFIVDNSGRFGIVLSNNGSTIYLRYSHIVIENVDIGYGSTHYDKLKTGWEIEFTATYPAYQSQTTHESELRVAGGLRVSDLGAGVVKSDANGNITSGSINWGNISNPPGDRWVGPDNTTGDIGRTGDVGIGLTSPSSKLHIDNGSIRLPASGYEGSGQIQSTGTVRFANVGAAQAVYAKQISLSSSWNDNDTYTQSNGVYSSGNIRAGGTTLALFANTSSGNVGIGTASINSKLHINTEGSATYPASHLFFSIDNASGTGTYSMGIDPNDDDKFKIGNSWNPTSGTYMTLTSTGDLGIATTDPTAKLEVNGHTKLKTLSQGYGSDERFYPNVVSDAQNTTVSGAWIVHTPIPRNSNRMFTIRVHGYGYGNGDVIDFTVSGYAYSGSNGNIDGGSGSVRNIELSDQGSDSWDKHIGIDANGNVAVAFGNTGSSAYYYRLSVDAWITRSSADYSTGWSIDRSTTTNFGWKDIHGPLTANWKRTIYINSSENVGIGGAPNNSYKVMVHGKLRTDGINETSDARLKKNVKSIEHALEKVMALRGVNYEWNAEQYPTKQFSEGVELGVIAQEVEQIVPELVDTDTEGFKSVQYSHLVPLLIEAIKEQQKIIEQQSNDMCLRDQKIENLTTKLDELEDLKTQVSELRGIIEMSAKNK
ncbi:MAG: tail fiber domain-containing protein [Chitinophagales bacterium]